MPLPHTATGHTGKVGLAFGGNVTAVSIGLDASVSDVCARPNSTSIAGFPCCDREFAGPAHRHQAAGTAAKRRHPGRHT